MKIRQQSKILSLKTNRSIRYQKSLTKHYLIESFYKLISLFRIKNPNLICQFNTNLQTVKSKSKLKYIFLNYKTINKILGPIRKTTQESIDFILLNSKILKYIRPDQISNYLERLNFKFLFNPLELVWKVKVSYLRINDITREIDLVEEIGRLHGFDNFLVTLPNVKIIGKEDLSYVTRRKLTNCLLNLGLNEIINNSLVNKITFLNNKIPLINPLISDSSNLRTSLLPGLIKTVQGNLKKGNSFREGFEYGHIFIENSKKKIREKECIAGIFGNRKKKLSLSGII